MPDTLHPPYLPTSQQYPKQINRWLDVNAQNGPLKRTQKYLPIPPFDQVETEWKGYSELIGKFDYVSPSRFSLIKLPDLSSLDLFLCIVSGGDRYSLKSGVGEVIFFPTEDYDNQVIEKHFSIEVWNTSCTPRFAQLDAEIDILTTVRGALDYRHGNDEALCRPSAFKETLFAISDIGYYPLPLSFDNNQPKPIEAGTTDDQGRIGVDDQGRIVISQ